NYGAIFSLWDRLFGTFSEQVPRDIGIKHSSPQTFLGLVRFGFTPEKHVIEYELDVDIKSMIAEAAYYKAEKRAFTPGNELRDWLEAKRDIIRMVYGDKLARKQANASVWPSLNSHCTFS
ncbi:MAG: DUF2934 domain-containing protein, partial [Methylococcaceae bacterium]